MKTIEQLAAEVNMARQRFIDAVSGISVEQSEFKPGEDSWCISQITEHMAWAEYSGVWGMYKAMEGLKNDAPVFAGEPIFEGLSIETVIEKTWKQKEQVPPIAKPHWGGPLSFWIIALRSNQMLLDQLVKELANYDPVKVIFPHILSGPLNAIQRLEFLRFHLDRHLLQVNNLKQHEAYPSSLQSPSGHFF